MSKINLKIVGTTHEIRNVNLADNLISRTIGLMFKKTLTGTSGLLIKPCNSIHTFFMFFDLDVLFISSSGEIVKIIRGMKPWRMSWIYFRASQVLELKAGSLPGDVKSGMKVEVIHV